MLKYDYDLRPLIGHEEDVRLFFSQREHYALLSWLSHQYNDQVLYDIGTYKGLSALALSSNKRNRVVSYDVGFFVRVKRPDHVEWRVGDFFTDKEIFKSPLIMFDVDPHDGKIERKFVDWLTNNNYKGTVVFDDIHLNDGMRQFWTSVTQRKDDYTNVGHWSGTGVVFFE